MVSVGGVIQSTVRDLDTFEDGRDTLNPNLSGYSAKRRLSRVLLPTPEGPDMSKGRAKCDIVASFENKKQRSGRRGTRQEDDLERTK